MELLPSALILIACISIGFSAVFIARSRSGINKHSRQHIKDIQQDMKYLSDQKKEDSAEYRKEILRLKGTINRMKAGPTITETDMQTESGIGELLIQKLGLGKYRKFLDPYMPKINQAILEKKDDIIETIQQQKAKGPNESGEHTQDSQTL